MSQDEVMDDMSGYPSTTEAALLISEPDASPAEVQGPGNNKAVPLACHVSLEEWKKNVNTALFGMFPNTLYRYTEVHALLLSWEEDDLGVSDEVHMLRWMFETKYNFTTVEWWKIPSKQPNSQLEDKLYEFRKSYSRSQSLLVVYYAGHGYMDSGRNWKWAAYR